MERGRLVRRLVRANSIQLQHADEASALLHELALPLRLQSFALCSSISVAFGPRQGQVSKISGERQFAATTATSYPEACHTLHSAVIVNQGMKVRVRFAPSPTGFL